LQKPNGTHGPVGGGRTGIDVGEFCGNRIVGIPSNAMTLAERAVVPVRHTVTTDGDEFMVAVPGASGRLVRAGRGNDRASVTSYAIGDVRMAVLDIGFPAAAEAEVVGDSVILATMLRAPGDGSWDGVTLVPGRTFVYPAGASHHGADPAGLRFALTVLPWTTFESAATDLGVDPSPGTNKHVVEGGPLPGIFAPLERNFASVELPPTVDGILADRLLDSAVRTLCVADPSPRRRTIRRWEDADLVHEALDYLDRTGNWMVPVLTLCRHVGVSERRLQVGFAAMLGMAPAAFMRHRALQAAHRALRDADPTTNEVSAIARGCGFEHLGRFAGYYRAVYGEPPSATLRRPRP
jgi:AraC-like DNA-binding protein